MSIASNVSFETLMEEVVLRARSMHDECERMARLLDANEDIRIEMQTDINFYKELAQRKDKKHLDARAKEVDEYYKIRFKNLTLLNSQLYDEIEKQKQEIAVLSAPSVKTHVDPDRPPNQDQNPPNDKNPIPYNLSYRNELWAWFEFIFTSGDLESVFIALNPRLNALYQAMLNEHTILSSTSKRVLK